MNHNAHFSLRRQELDPMITQVLTFRTQKCQKPRDPFPCNGKWFVKDAYRSDFYQRISSLAESDSACLHGFWVGTLHDIAQDDVIIYRHWGFWVSSWSVGKTLIKFEGVLLLLRRSLIWRGSVRTFQLSSPTESGFCAKPCTIKCKTMYDGLVVWKSSWCFHAQTRLRGLIQKRLYIYAL